MKKILSLLALAAISALTVCGEEISAALPVITYRGSLVMAEDETYPSGLAKINRTMTFRVYDTDVQGSDPLWESKPMDVIVNPDGSFEAKVGDLTLAELITTGTVTHVGLQLGSSREITPRRALRPVAAVTRAIVAEGVTPNMKIGTLETSDVTAKSMSVSLAEISERLFVEAGTIKVEPFMLLEGESTRLLRGKGMKVFAGEPKDLGSYKNVFAQQILVTAPADGVALIHCDKMTTQGYWWRTYAYNRIPGTIQFCREKDEIKAPTDASSVKVSFWEFAKEGGR